LATMLAVPLGVSMLVLPADAIAADPAAAPAREIKAPKLKTFAPAEYPPTELAAGRSVVITLALDLDAYGKVTHVQAVESASAKLDEAFAASAQAAAMKLEFEPAEVNGKPTAVRFNFRYRFEAPAPPAVPVAPEKPQELAIKVVAKSKPEQVKSGIDEELLIQIPKSRLAVGSSLVAADAAARSVPGSMGDALVVVQNLPSVARPPAGSNQVIVWGSSAAETRIYVDDVPIPNLYHRGGLRSVLNSELVSSVELSPAGFGAAFGRATGGLLRVRTANVGRDGVGGYASLDPIDASAAMTYRAKGSPWSVAFGMRYGLLDKLLPLVFPNVERTVPLPGYGDLAAKLSHRDAEGSTELLLMGSADRLNRYLPAPRGGRETSEATSSSFRRLSLKRDWKVAVGSATAVAWVGYDRDSTLFDFGGIRAQQSELVLRAGARAMRTLKLHSAVLLTLGADIEFANHDLVREGTLSLPGLEGDKTIFGQAPADRIAFDRWTNTTVGLAPYAELEWRPNSAFTLTPGFRLENFMVAGTRVYPVIGGGVGVGYQSLETFPDPRLRAEYKFSSVLAVNLAGGVYHQHPAAGAMSSVFGGTALVASNAQHVVVGAVVSPFEFLRIEGSLYAKQSSALPARTAAESPALAGGILSTGEGRSTGLQLVVRVPKWKAWSGWVSYALSRSQRRDSNEVRWRLFDFDQTHVAVAVVGWEPVRGWKLGARVRASSGYPRTQVTGAVYDSQTDAFQPIRGDLNRERLPFFFQADLHAEYGQRTARFAWSLYFDLLNVTSRKNAAEVVYSYDYSERGYLTDLPILALLGARVEL
jgi:TonB family protein